LSFGVPALSFRLGTADLGARTRASATLAIAAPAGIVVALGLLPAAHVVNPGARAALDTAITLSAVAAAFLLRANLERGRQLNDLLLLFALLAGLVVDFVFRAGPALSSGVRPEAVGPIRFGAELIVALLFAAAAFAPRRTVPDPGRRLITSLVVSGAIVALLGELFEEVLLSQPNHESFAQIRSAAASTRPLAVTVAAVLIVASVAFVARSRRGEPNSWLPAAASALLAGATLQYLELPVVATNWVTLRDGLRLAAYALLLRAGYVRYAKARRSEAQAVLYSERERIARDLHDGLAQDLACIAAQGQRLDSSVGPEHPLMVATRRAIAASRGAIADLWASTAPSTDAALRLIANELEHRFDVEIDVRVETDAPLTGDGDLEPHQREDLVRIVREAIVNAAQHGGATRVDVALSNRERDLLVRVSDDGRGIADTMRPGFGVHTMRARAASLGGQLTAYARAEGGTELELVVP
jgi:signal transduction histidine kinase